jgi:uncharacterized protein YkwD
MKELNFKTFFTVVLTMVLFSSFAMAQKNKTIASKATTPNKSTAIKPATTDKPVITTIKPVTTDKPIATAASSTVPAYSAPAAEQAILDEINVARNDPQKYIGYLEEYRKLFKDNMLYIPGAVPLVTNEGVAAVDDAINFLKTATKLSPYTISKGLSQSANLQLKDLMEDSSIGHKSKDGGDLTTRLAKFGSVGNIYAENISYYAKTPRDIVLTMLLDDGYKSRSHRKNIFSPTFKQIGLGFGNGKKGEILCVVVFADSFRETGSTAPRQL